MPDFRYTEDFPDSQMTNVPYTNSTSKPTEEEKSQIPKKVCIVYLSLLLLFLSYCRMIRTSRHRWWTAATRIN